MTNQVRKFGILITILSASYLLLNNLVKFLSHINTVSVYINLLLILFIFIMFISTKCPHGDCIQVFTLFISSIITFIFSPNFGYGLAQLFILISISNKYNFLKNKILFKLTIFSIFYFVIMFFSQIYKHGIYKINWTICFYYTIIMFVVILIKLEDIKFEIEKDKEHKKIVKKLIKDLIFEKEFNESIKSEYLNPKEFKLTQAEFILLKNLCIYNDTNLDLARRLGKSVNTIKVQMKQILIKSGAESRHQLIDLCKYYFVENE